MMVDVRIFRNHELQVELTVITSQVMQFL